MTTTIRSQGAPAPQPRPAPSTPRPYQFPRFHRRRLGNGLQLVVAPIAKLPLATVIALADAGAVAEPGGKEGVAQLTAQLLLEGTERCDGAKLTQRFELLGASADSYADWDAAGIRLTALTEHLPAAFDLLAEVLRTPAFRDREVERLKAERLAELLQLRAEPRGLADELFTRVLYDPRSRFARPDGGDEASVAALSSGDVRDFYHARYQPSSLTIVIAGDVTPEGAEELVARTLGDWRGPAPAPARTGDAPARTSRAVHLVSKADAPQSELRIGHVGLPRTHPDYFPAVVMNAVLGGLFNSRINLNLREAHGYTYGAFSSFDWRRQAGPFVVSTAVQSEVTEASAREVLVEIDRMRAEPIGVEELSLATSYLDGVFPIRYETTAAIATALTGMVVYGLPADYFDAYRDRVRAVTRDDVLRAAREHLHPDALQLLVVGDPAVVRPPLEALGFGPLTVYDASGAPA